MRSIVALKVYVYPNDSNETIYTQQVKIEPIYDFRKGFNKIIKEVKNKVLQDFQKKHPGHKNIKTRTLKVFD